MFSLDSVTFGWSNGSMPSTTPATAVAYSQARNCAPSGPLTATSGADAAARHAPAASAPP